MEAITHLEKLGFRAKEKVTEIEGVIESIDFDLYGCIQVLLRYSKDDESKNSGWLDVSRIEITSDKRVMGMPDYDLGYVAEGKKGAAKKPIK